MQLQTQAHKISEVNYRKKISAQHTGKKVFFKDEPDQQQIKEILKKRIGQYKNDFQNLKKNNLIKSPFLEIGAEYALASSYLKSKFKIEGIACDISFHSLKKARHFARIFKLKNNPMLACADADNLPFKSDSFPFIFVYETLHHFPHPSPVLNEAYRVLAPGGVCLVGSDPIKQGLQINLWHRPNKLRIWEKLLKMIFILPFISHIGKTEVEKGILEGAFPLSVWKDSLSIFEKVEATVRAFPWGPEQKIYKNDKNLWTGPNLITKAALLMFGGGLQAVCKKEGKLENKKGDIYSFLICPDCKATNKAENSLEKDGSDFVCPQCKNIYLQKNNVLVLLQKDLEKRTHL